MGIRSYMGKCTKCIMAKNNKENFVRRKEGGMNM